MRFHRKLALWAALPLSFSAHPAFGEIWPASLQTQSAAPGPGRLQPPPAPAPDVVSPPADRPREGFVPRPAVPGPAQFPELEEDDDPIGRRFVEPPPLPEPPPGLEIVADPEANPAFAGTPLTLEEALALASQNNPTLIQAQAQIQGTLGLAVEAGLWPNPVFIYVGEQIFVNREDETTPGEWQGAQLRQEFVTADKRDISRAKFLQRTKVAEWVAAQQQWRVCNDVRIHYWRAVGNRELVGIHRELVKSAEDTVVTTRERWNLGQATRADLHLANVALQETRLNLLLAENDYLQAYETLIALIGVPLEGRSVAGTLDGEIVPVEFQTTLDRYYAEAPQVMQARLHLREEQITLKRELVEPVPNVFVQAGSGYNFEARETTMNANVFFEVPIWDRNQGNIRRAESDVVRQRAEVRRTELFLRQELARVYRDYLVALQHVRQFRDVILPEAREAYKNQLDAYSEDRQQWGDVLATQQRYFGLRLLYVTNLIALRTNETLIQGYLLHGGLLPAPPPVPVGHLDVTAQPR